MDLDRLDNAYRRYGFRVSGDRGVRVYTSTAGYIPVAEIVPLTRDADVEGKKRTHEHAGFACRTQHYSAPEEAEFQLFKAFFHVEATRARLGRDIDSFLKTQDRALGGKYRYVPCPYLLDDAPDQDLTVVQIVAGRAASVGPALVIVEAAAGHGKTCTAYELLGTLLSGSDAVLPLFVELSRNRTAKIFKYVLLDEIDRNFSHLSREVVEAEIAAGRVPLIIDGFDELLARGQDDPDAFEECQSMLGTIGELLKDNAKIVVTTRKSAIFSGDRFNDWIAESSARFSITRICLQPPRLSDWLSEERLSELRSRDLPVEDLGNPVLLTFLKNAPDAVFREATVSTDSLVDKYLTSLLDRELERQNLRIPADQQIQIYTSLAWEMLELNFNSESREFIADVILAGSESILTKSLSYYRVSERPSTRALADTLAGHALLDRVGRSADRVGFINDFVFGLFLGRAIVERADKDWLGPYDLILTAVTAFRTLGTSARKALLDKLQYAHGLFGTQDQLMTDVYLAGRDVRRFEQATFERMVFRRCELGSVMMTDCVFSNCVFEDVVFRNLDKVGFLACSFRRCTTPAFEGEHGLNWAFECKEFEGDCLQGILSNPSPTPAILSISTRQRVLEQFWPPGRARAMVQLQVRTLFKGFSQGEQRSVAEAIDELRRDGLIDLYGGSARLTLARMGEIVLELGRDHGVPE